MDRRFVRSASLLLAVVALAGLPTSVLAQEEDPPPPSDAEVTKFFAVYSALLDDPALAPEVCGLGSDSSAGDDSGSQSAAAAGRKIDANPRVGPIVRRQGLTGRRFVEVSMHLFAGYLGLAIADDADRGKPKQGGVGANRAALLKDSASARVAAAHQPEMARLQARMDELCAAAADDGGYEQDAAEDSE